MELVFRNTQKTFDVRGSRDRLTALDDVFRMPFLRGHFDNKAEFETAANAYFAWELHLPEQIARSGEISFSRRAP